MACGFIVDDVRQGDTKTLVSLKGEQWVDREVNNAPTRNSERTIIDRMTY